MIKSESNTIHLDDVTFLTDSCTESTNPINQLTLKNINLPFDDTGMFYPLTKQERKYVVEDGVFLTNPNLEVWAQLGQTCLYKRQKYICLEVLHFFDDLAGDEPNHDTAFNDHLKSFDLLDSLAKSSNGYLIFDDNQKVDTYHGEYISYVLIPFCFAFECADNIDDWKAFLSIADPRSDNFIDEAKKAISQLKAFGHLPKFISILESGFALGNIKNNNVSFERSHQVNSGRIDESISFSIQDQHYYGVLAVFDKNENKINIESIPTSSFKQQIYDVLEQSERLQFALN